MRLQIAGLIFLILFFFKIPLSHSTDFTCSNTASWVSIASNTNPYDFYNHRIKPDGSPLSTLDFAQQLDAFYSNNEYELVVNPDSECYAAVTCTEGTGYDFSQPFNSDHPAWSDSRCACSHHPQTGCNRVTWHRRGHPNLVSGVVGTPFPPYPTPTYPSSWNERYLYSHTFSQGTNEATIALNITANINTDYLPTGSSATATKCSEDTTTIGGEEYTRKYYLVNGLANHDQTFNATQPYQEWNENWGHCGNVRQYWTESTATVVSWPSVVKAVGVIAYVSPGAYEYSDRPYCQEGWTDAGSGNGCWHTVAPSGTTCPPGYTYRYGAFGSSSCRTSEPRSLRACPSGWEINPANTNQCRRAMEVADVPTDTPPDDETYDGTGSGTTPTGGGSSGSGTEGTGSDSDGSGGDQTPSDTTPPWCTGDGYTWDSSTSTCTSPDGGEVVTPGPDPDADPDSDPDPDETPDPDPDPDDTPDPDPEPDPDPDPDSGDETFAANGFYTPTYGADTTLRSLFETSITNLSNETLRTRLLAFVPPAGTAALPNKCMTVSFSSTPICIDFSSYAFVFQALRAFMYLVAGWTAYRIVIGA